MVFGVFWFVEMLDVLIWFGIGMIILFLLFSVWLVKWWELFIVFKVIIREMEEYY